MVGKSGLSRQDLRSDAARYCRFRFPLSPTSREGITPLSLPHQGQFPATTISFNLPDGISLSDAVNAIHKAELDIGMPASITGKFAGTAQAFQDSLNSQPILIGTALLVVYIILGMLYESLIHPLTIISTLPSAGVGALIALVLFRTQLTIVALIGIILLIGIVKKNAIMMIDFALAAERNEGLSTRDAIFQACMLRFRPIMMTTACALLGGMPLALGLGSGSELRRPLGITIVGGLLVSQMLTLFTTPVIYLVTRADAPSFQAPSAQFPASARHPHSRRIYGGLMARSGHTGIHRIPVCSACAVGPKYQRPVAPPLLRLSKSWPETTSGKWPRPATNCSKANGGRSSASQELNRLEEHDQHQQPEREAGRSAVSPGAHAR